MPTLDRELGRRHPLRILVVEDNAVNQKLALLLLSKLSYNADIAANGREAIIALERQPYDLVFMDLHMPVLDGLSATREICERWPAAQRPHLVAMTASAMIEDRQQCQAAGMDDYIGKPVRMDDLASKLAQALMYLATLLTPTSLLIRLDRKSTRLNSSHQI